MKKRGLLTNYLLLVLFVYPLFFFPLLRDIFILGKSFFLIGAVFVGLILWLLTLWQEKEVRIYFARFEGILLTLSLFLGGYLFFLSRGNRYEALLSQGGVVTFWFLFVFSFLLGQTELCQKPKKLFLVLGFSGAVAALVTIVLFILPEGIYPLKVFGENSPLVIGNSLWSPLGSIIELVWFLIPLLVFVIAYLIQQVNRKEKLVEWQFFSLAVILLVGLAAAAYQIFEKNVPFLDYRSSWAVAVEAFKRRPLFGIGPGLFREAFTLYKTVEFNTTSWWAIRFIRASGIYLHWWTELGVLGLGLLGWFLVGLTKEVKTKAVGLRWTWWALMVLGLFLPGAFIFPFLLLVMAVLIQERKEVVLPGSDLSLKIVSGLVVIALFAGGYFWQRALTGEYVFFKFVRGIAVGQAKDSDYYRAVRLVPVAADFRTFRSQIDISILDNVIANVDQNQGEVDEETNQRISLLAQEAISEAKAAAALRPRNVFDWENLAQTYRRLINIAEGSEQWTVSAYQQAVALDSLNPRLRVDLGGVFYALGDYEQAGRQFEVAAQLKPDYANGWYNWAWALKQQGKTLRAVEAMQQALFLVEPDTADYQKAQEELEAWKKELGEEAGEELMEKRELEQLTIPEALPEPQVPEPIQLPEEAAPELEIIPVLELTETPEVTGAPETTDTPEE